MKGSTRVIAGAAAIVLLGAGFATTASAQDDTQVVPFSEPSRIGKVEVQLLSGSITVRGENRRDVAVVLRSSSPGRAQVERAAPPGMRRLTQTPSFTISEERNEIKIESASMGKGEGSVEIRVPLKANLKLGSVNGGTVTVENVEGDLEIQNVNGPVSLNNVAGSVVANSVNGGVTARLTRVTADKAMAFTSFNGKVDVTLPPSIKANLKMRSDQGDVFTDFDVQLRQGGEKPNATRNDGRYRVEVNRSVYGSVNGGGPEIELRTFNGSVYLRKGQ
jgi:DUF4097 and DUF4098 domain-containing protein YvlB